jgi:hypothetical protein
VDLALFARVAWRFRLLVTLGLSLAFCLAFLSFVSVDFGAGFKMAYRETEQWETLSTLFVTSPGSAIGSVSGKGTTADVQAAESARVASLTGLYMQLATTDPVIRLVERSGPLNGIVRTFPVTSTGDGGGDPLPMITFSAVGPTPSLSYGLARRHINAFLTFLRRDQVAKGVPPEERITVEVVRQPQPPVLLQGRKKTRPIIVFLTVAIATFGLAFILENLRPRVRAVPSSDASRKVSAEPSRRTA